MTFRAGGLISGLDTNTIIEQLVALERRPIKNLEARRNTLNQQKTVIANIEAALKDLLAVIDLFQGRSLLTFRAESTNTSVLSATANNGACEGRYSIEVTQMARAEQNRSSVFTSASDVVKAGMLTIQVQGRAAVDIAVSEGATLNDVAFAINASGARVRATVVDTGTGVYLNLYALDSGHAIGAPSSDAVVITESYTGSSGRELSFTEVQTAQNALFSVDGLSIERRSNTVTDVIRGLELKLAGTGSSTVTVGPDLEGVKNNIKNFMEKYNKVASLLNGQLSYVKGQTAPVLFGDASLRNLFSRLQSVLAETVESSSTLSTLRSIGLELTSGGQLAFDEQTFTTAAGKDFGGIESIFTATNGICDRLEAIIKDYTQSGNGLFQFKKDALNRQDKNLSSQIERLEARLDAYEKHLISQFTYMETVLAQLKSQQNSIGSIYNLLSG